MKLRDLEYLVALADHRNFHRAAEVCNVSQPTLSTQIRKLEQELGFALFERAPRNLLVTDDGLIVVDHARRALSEVARIRALSERTGRGQRLRLGVFPTLGPYLLPHIVPDFVRQVPGIDLALTEAKSGDLVHQLVNGEIDAALLALPVTDSRLAGRALFKEPFRLAVPPAHPLASLGSVVVPELAGQRLMLLEQGHCLRDQALDLCRMSGAHEVDDFRGTSLETLRQMVIAGMGATLLPSLACRGDSSMTVLPIDDPGFARRIGLFWRHSSNQAALMDTMVRIISEVAGRLEDVSLIDD